MMETAEVQSLNLLVLVAAFVLALLLGALLQRSNFCTMGAVADVFTMGDWNRARAWVLAVATAAIGFGLMNGLGWINAAHAFQTAPKLLWLSHLLGGLLFGLGMVLASGCGARALVRMGGGSLKALMVFVVAGLCAYATLHGITAVLRVNTVDAVVLLLPVGQDLPALVTRSAGSGRQTLAAVLGVGFGAALWVWVLSSRPARAPEVIGTGLAVGLLVTGLWWVTGVLGFVPEHPDTLEPAFLATASRGMESFNLISPMAQTLDWLLWYSDRNQMLTLGVVTVPGLVLGSLLVALWQRSFRWEGFSSTADTAHHLIGAALMGVGAVTAMGCTFGQGITGLSTLSLGSAIATAAMVVGALLGLRWQMWRLERLD